MKKRNILNVGILGMMLILLQCRTAPKINPEFPVDTKKSRQAYINVIAAQYGMTNFCRVHYDPGFSNRNQTLRMIGYPEEKIAELENGDARVSLYTAGDPRRIGMHIKPDVFVSQDAFDHEQHRFKSEDEFKAALLRHEGQHAYDLYEGLVAVQKACNFFPKSERRLDGVVLQAVMEYRAYQNLLFAIIRKEFKVSKEFEQQNITHLARNVRFLENYLKDPDTSLYMKFIVKYTLDN